MDRLVTLLLAVLTALLSAGYVTSLGCFVCSSINNSEPDCEDTFNNTGKFYSNYCEGGRKGRFGTFPGTSCIKLKGTIAETGDDILVRACVVDNGDINSETEIGRSNHCGLVDLILFDGKSMHGCVVSCHTNGCNHAPSSVYSPNLPILLFSTFLAAFTHHKL